MDNVRQLITRVRDTRGWTYPDLVARGGGIGLKRWQQLGSDDDAITTIPLPDTIRTMAQGLGVSERTVLLACGASAGLMVDDEEDEGLLLQILRPMASRIPHHMVAALLTIITGMATDADTPPMMALVPEPPPAAVPPPAAPPAARARPTTKRAAAARKTPSPKR